MVNGTGLCSLVLQSASFPFSLPSLVLFGNVFTVFVKMIHAYYKNSSNVVKVHFISFRLLSEFSLGSPFQDSDVSSYLCGSCMQWMRVLLTDSADW